MHNLKKLSPRLCMSILRKGLFIAFFCLWISAIFADVGTSTYSRSYKPKVKMSSFSTGGPLIVLDAGHGGVDEGTKVRSFQEKKITLATVLYTKKYLEEKGYKVILTRGKDTYVSLPRRVAIANKIKSTIFVSVHYNASKNSIAQGIEIFYYDGKDTTKTRSSRRLANCILHYVIDQTEAASRGVKVGNYHVIRETQMPSVLIEGGFVTNYEECVNLKKRAYLEKIGKGIASGIDKFLSS